MGLRGLMPSAGRRCQMELNGRSLAAIAELLVVWGSPPTPHWNAVVLRRPFLNQC